MSTSHRATSRTNRATRRALVGIGVLAAAGGAWWYGRQASTPPSADAMEPAAAGLWELRLPRPDGGELVLAEFRGRPLLINFWATWCPPCIKELPEFDRFARSHVDRVRVVGLAIDSLAPVQDFLKRQPVSFAIGLAGFNGTDLARNLGNSSGVLPFTVLLNADGVVAQRKIGETSYAELESWSGKL
jgi:thiol-disulfide isomerase/thioredoxin